MLGCLPSISFYENFIYSIHLKTYFSIPKGFYVYRKNIAHHIFFDPVGVAHFYIILFYKRLIPSVSFYENFIYSIHLKTYFSIPKEFYVYRKNITHHIFAPFGVVHFCIILFYKRLIPSVSFYDNLILVKYHLNVMSFFLRHKVYNFHGTYRNGCNSLY